MRMVQINILNTVKTLEMSIDKGVKKYFYVSTDKATNPKYDGRVKKYYGDVLALQKRMTFRQHDLQMWHFLMVHFCMGLIRMKKEQLIVAHLMLKGFCDPDRATLLVILFIWKKCRYILP